MPGDEAGAANRWVNYPVCTGMGHARNAILVASGDAVIASGGGWGTLSEIALAVRLGRLVVVRGAWQEIGSLTGDGAASNAGDRVLTVASSSEECVELAIALTTSARTSPSR